VNDLVLCGSLDSRFRRRRLASYSLNRVGLPNTIRHVRPLPVLLSLFSSVIIRAQIVYLLAALPLARLFPQAFDAQSCLAILLPLV
jgi:hypothetical protein